jgi:N-acetylmuramoyl-L-alanine amidase
MTVRIDRRIAKRYSLVAYPVSRIADATIHCAATPEGKAFTAEQIVDMDVKRFKQPSYHVIVELDGTKVQCLDFTQRGAHVAGHNTGNIGVCYVGGVHADDITKAKDTRTPAQKQALRELAADLKATYGVHVRGHRDWPKVAKACPCFDVATQL